MTPYRFLQAEEVRRCLKKGLTESESMPLEDSLLVAEAVDEISRQIGLGFEDVAKKEDEEKKED